LRGARYRDLIIGAKSFLDFIEYKKARAIATRTINSKRKKNFIEFINSINKYTSLSYVWKKMSLKKIIPKYSMEQMAKQ